MSRAAVIGAGTMGNGIAHVLAQHEWDVALVDSAPAALEKATSTIRSNLERQVKKGTLPAEAPAAGPSRSMTVTLKPRICAAMATERPTTPAPMTTISDRAMSLIVHFARPFFGFAHVPLVLCDKALL